MSNTGTQHPTFDFDSHPSVSSFAVPYEDYNSSHAQQNMKYNFIAAGALVFDNSTPNRILLIQRAASDSMPNLWEIPGGSCDKEDPSILHGAVRELWEESGLKAVSIGPQVGGGYLFKTRAGKQVCKFNFLVEAEKDADGNLEVKLSASEHQNYLWATEEEVKGGKASDVDLNFTNREQKGVVLQAFEARRDLLKSQVPISCSSI
jgi:8-oxo-dGTP pyrophosphatase MutT (NUDIX family)